MGAGFSIEAELQRRAENDEDAKDFWHRYEIMKGYLAREYYRWVQAECAFFTDHGEQHIQSVIEAASLLLSKHKSPEVKDDLTSLDLFLTLCGILWHDVGNVYGRSNHASRVAEMTEEIKKLAFPNPDIHRLVDEISRAHSGKDGLKIPKTEEDCSAYHKTYTVYPKALAAIVRFADEISENQSRISHALLPHIPEESRIFWEYANCISASRPDPARERVVVTVTIQHDKAISRAKCTEFSDRVDGAGEISLIEYVLCRLEKINNERAYCAPEFRRFASIREVVGRLAILRNTRRLEDYDLEVVFGDSGLSQGGYPNIQVVHEFFKRNPSWDPLRLEEALGR